MMKKKLILSAAVVAAVGAASFAALIYLTSCSDGIPSTVTLDLNSGREVKIDSIAAECLLNVRALAIVDDTLVIANDNQDVFFETYQLPSIHHIASGGVRGVGPGELINPMLNSMKPYPGHCIMMKSSAGFGIDIIDIESLRQINSLKQRLPSGWNFVQDILFYKDDIMMGQNGDSPHVWALFDKNGDIITEFPQNIPSEVTALANDDFTKMVYDTSWGANSAKQNTVAIGYRTFPVVEFYKSDGKLAARLEANHSIGDRLDNWLNKMQSTDEYVYLNFRNLNSNANSANTIVKVDWQGKVRDVYAIHRPVYSFAVDQNNKRIIFTSKSDNDEDFLYYFEI